MSPDPAPGGASRPAGDLADAVAAAVVAVPGVVDLHAGTYGEVATYLPGRRVTGVRVRDDGVEVHVVLSYGSPVLDTAQAVRAAVQVLSPGRVDVTVQDVVDLAREPSTERGADPEVEPALSRPGAGASGPPARVER